MFKNEKGQWFRFSLRRLIILVTVAVCIFAWTARKFRQSIVHRRAVEILAKHGFSVTYSYRRDDKGVPTSSDLPLTGKLRNRIFGSYYHIDNSKVWLVDQKGKKPIPTEVLRELSNLTHLERLLIHSPNLGDDAMTSIAKCKDLKWLFIGVDITDEGLQHCNGLQKLDHLFLTGTAAGLLLRSEEQNPADVAEYATDVTHDAIQKLNEILDDCHIVY